MTQKEREAYRNGAVAVLSLCNDLSGAVLRWAEGALTPEQYSTLAGAMMPSLKAMRALVTKANEDAQPRDGTLGPKDNPILAVVSRDAAEHVADFIDHHIPGAWKPGVKWLEEIRDALTALTNDTDAIVTDVADLKEPTR